MLWRGLLAMLVAVFLTGTAGAQQFKKRDAAPPATSTAKPKATAKKPLKKKTAPRKRTRTVKKKPRAKVEEARRPMP